MSRIHGPVAVLGASGHAKVVISTLLANGISEIRIFDDDPNLKGKKILGFEVVGSCLEVSQSGLNNSVFAIGSNQTRKKLHQELSTSWLSLIHPQAYVHESVRIGKGAVVFAGAVVQPDSTIGDHSIINTSSSIDHDGIVGNFVHLAPGVHLAGNVTIGDGAFLGVGVSVIPGINIGEWATVGAGATVVEPLAPFNLYIGTPAKVIRGRADVV